MEPLGFVYLAVNVVATKVLKSRFDLLFNSIRRKLCMIFFWIVEDVFSCFSPAGYVIILVFRPFLNSCGNLFFLF